MSSESDVVIGLDLGTTSAKAVAVNPTGQTLAAAESQPIRTTATPPGASEQEPDEIFEAAVAAGRGLTDELGDAVHVRALSIAAQSGSVIVHDGQGTPTSRAITWMDTRSRHLVDSWSADTNRLIRDVSGWQSSPGLGLATIAWLRSRDALPHPARFTSVDDYLTSRFTGRAVTNPSNAAGMQLMDVSSLEWSDQLCSLAAIETVALSPIRRSGSKAGQLTQAAAEALGLTDSAEVVVGGHDQACAALGLGATAAGAIVLSTGTAWVLTVMTDRPAVPGLPDSLNLSPGVLDQCWSASKNLGGLGAAIAWALDGTSLTESELEAATHNQHGSPDAPFFVPALHDQDRISWGNFVSDGAVDAVARVHAVFEACALEVKLAVEQAGAFTNGGSATTVVGGGTRARHLTQAIANATGRELLIRPDDSWPALGAARLAATACGWPTASDSAAAGVRVEPEMGMLGLVEKRYQRYRELRGEGSP